MLIKIEHTPNPNAIKFVIEKQWIDYVWECVNQYEADKSQISKKLFKINGVIYLLFGKKFVVINKNKDIAWEEIEKQAVEIISDFIKSKDNVFENDTTKIVNNKKDVSQLEQKMIEVLELKVQPAIETHGGSIEFMKFEDKTLYLNLKGACRDCPSSEVTLQHGILNLMQYFFPEIKEVKSV